MKPENPTVRLFVSPHGNDRWSGRLAAPNKAGNDGPFATVDRARREVRRLKVNGELPRAVRVVLRGGRYPLRRPLVFTAKDSGSPPLMGDWQKVIGPPRDITYAAYPGEQPILSGGRQITGWRETTLHGQRAWIVRLPGVAGGRWWFTQLWVNNRRAQRPRLPRSGYFRVEKPLGKIFFKGNAFQVYLTGQDRFRFVKGDLRRWRNVRDIEFVALHFWIESRIPFSRIDPSRREARLQWKARMRLTDDLTKTGAPYYVENIFEELKEPGQWYLDRSSGELYYLPLPGETVAGSEIIAPVLPCLAFLRGDAARNRPVEHIHFDGITFSHSESPNGPAPTATPQAACHVPGAVIVQDARCCAVRRGEITHVGNYGIEVRGASSDVEITGNRITDLAAGGVKIWHTREHQRQPGAKYGWADQTFIATCERIQLTDNEIADGGHRWRQAVGVLIGKCSGNQILHNHIHDFDYSGVSVGWTWGYDESHACGNVIEHNHIHHIGRGVLSDMGGIYTLGVSPGTRIRYNLIHDVESRGYGGWGIYADEGSSHLLIENNLSYRTKSQGFHQHYGRENIIRNNVFALGREGGFSRSRLEAHDSFHFHHNIILLEGDGPLIDGNWTETRASIDRNLYFHVARQPLKFAGENFAAWRKRGSDRHSRIADPRFVAAAAGDFRIRRGSPALAIGFIPFELRAGPRTKAGTSIS